MTYSAKSIANFYIQLASDRGVQLTPMKLQKLLYYAHGWYAGHTRQPLINETIEAWQYGPVIPSIYHEFKAAGSGAIGRLATDLSREGSGFRLVTVPPPSDPGLLKFLTNVFDNYSPFPATKLSEMTHAPGGPWDVTWQEGKGVKGLDIPLERVVSHFGEAVEKAKTQALV